MPRSRRRIDRRSTDDGVQDSQRLRRCGALSSVLTLHLGFDFNSDEYTILRLARLDAAARPRSDGGWENPPLKLNQTREERENHVRTRRFVTQQLIAQRDPDTEIEQTHEDVAAGLQACLDRSILHLVEHFAEATRLRRVAIAGGVALNTTASGRLLGSGAVDEIYVRPAAADDGASLGAGLQRAALAGEIVNRRSLTPFYGPGTPTAASPKLCATTPTASTTTALDELSGACTAAAELIAAGEVGTHPRQRFRGLR